MKWVSRQLSHRHANIRKFLDFPRQCLCSLGMFLKFEVPTVNEILDTIHFRRSQNTNGIEWHIYWSNNHKRKNVLGLRSSMNVIPDSYGFGITSASVWGLGQVSLCHPEVLVSDTGATSNLIGRSVCWINKPVWKKKREQDLAPATWVSSLSRGVKHID